jgi:large subunit ribosomal protein L10
LLQSNNKLEVVKNTLLVKAMRLENDYGELPSVLTGNSAIFISELQMDLKIIKDSVKISKASFERCLHQCVYIEMIN